MKQNKYKQQYQNELELYQFKTARRRRRDAIGQKDKNLIAIHREQKELTRLDKARPWIPLEPPVMRGWKRYFVLREDVARSNDAGMYERLLSKINTVQYSARRDFKKSQRRNRKKIWMPTEQHTEWIDPRDWKKKEFTEKEAAMFELRELQLLSHPTAPWVLRFVFKEPWRFALRVRPNLITKVQLPDIELLRRESYLGDLMRQRNLYGRMNKVLHGGGYRRSMRRPDPVYPAKYAFKRMPLHQLIEE